jgi:hypothetical protein
MLFTLPIYDIEHSLAFHKPKQTHSYHSNQKSASLILITIYFLGNCYCSEVERRVVLFSSQKAKIDWLVPNITCPYRFILKYTTKPRQTSPHSFGVGDYVLSYTYHLYGGHNVTCNVYVTISKMVSGGGGGSGFDFRRKYSVYTTLSDVNRTIIFFILHNTCHNSILSKPLS